MSFSFSGMGHVEEESQERGVIVGLAQAVAGVDGAKVDFSGRFFTGEVSELNRQFDEEDAANRAPEPETSDQVEGAPSAGEAEFDRIASGEPVFNEDQSAKSAGASQPAPDGSDGS